MIWIYAQVGEQQLLAAGVATSAGWFDGHKNRVDVFECFRIARFQNPALFADVVFVEDAQAERLLFVRSSPAPLAFCTPGCASRSTHKR